MHSQLKLARLANPPVFLPFFDSYIPIPNFTYSNNLLLSPAILYPYLPTTYLVSSLSLVLSQIHLNFPYKPNIRVLPTDLRARYHRLGADPNGLEVEVVRGWLRVGRALRCWCWDREEKPRFKLDGPSVTVTIPFSARILLSSDVDYDTERLSLVIAVKAAIASTCATKTTRTYSPSPGAWTAGTFVNVSTSFADGFRYEFGTEVGTGMGRIRARTYECVMKSMWEKGRVGDVLKG